MLDNMRWIVFLFKIYITFYLYVCSLIFSVFFFFLYSSQLNIHFIKSNLVKFGEMVLASVHVFCFYTVV